MSYPTPTYLGESGEVTARFRPADTPPELPRPGGGAASYLATGASTGGKFGLFRWDMGTQPGGADPHFHRTISESFFVLSGTVTIYDGNEWVPATAGDFTYVPEGGLHGFRNDSGEPASMLTRAMHPESQHELTEEDVAIARVIGDVWLSALVGWVTGRSTAAETAAQMEKAVHLLLRD